MRRYRTGVVAGFAAFALLAAGCGTRVDRDAYYRGLAEPGAAAGGQTAPQGVEPASDFDGEPPADEPSLPAAERVAAERVASRAAVPGATIRPNPAGVAPPAAATALGRDVVGDSIPVGMHIPITGAAPLPTDFMDYVDVLQEWFDDNPVHGRTVRLLIADDGYEPAKGQAACRKLAGEPILFAVGHTMPAVQDGCAGLFHERGIPYLMRGTYEGVLDGRRHAYFGTISDDRQGGLLADYAIARLGAAGKRTAVVYQNDQTAAQATFVDRIQERGGTIVAREESVPRQSDYSATVQKLEQSGAQIVFLSMPPVDTIKLTVQAQGQGYRPQWLGGATYWNYNMTVESAGMALDGAVSFSPWPAVDAPGAAEFVSVYEQYREGRQPQDIGLIIWGWMGLIRAALDKAGPDLSRASFAEALDTLEFAPPYWQPIAYSPTDRVGTSSVAVFRADGSAKRWRQVESFTSSF